MTEKNSIDERGARDTLPEDRLENYVYEEKSLLEMPDMPDKADYVYRWLRVSIRGEDDVSNISSRLRDGWEFVKITDLPDEMRRRFVFPKGLGKTLTVLDGIVRNGDLAWAKWPRKMSEAYQRHVEMKAARMEAAYSGKRITDPGSQTVIYNDGTSHKTVGGRHPRFDT